MGSRPSKNATDTHTSQGGGGCWGSSSSVAPNRGPVETDAPTRYSTRPADATVRSGEQGPSRDHPDTEEAPGNQMISSTDVKVADPARKELHAPARCEELEAAEAGLQELKERLRNAEEERDKKRRLVTDALETLSAVKAKISMAERDYEHALNERSEITRLDAALKEANARYNADISALNSTNSELKQEWNDFGSAFFDMQKTVSDALSSTLDRRTLHLQS